MKNISNHSIFEEKSDKNASLLELLENHNRIAIVKIDSKLQAEYVSPSMLEVLGYSPEHFIGNSVLGVVHADDKPRLEHEITKTIKAKTKIWEDEYRVLTKTGDILWVETKAHLFYNDKGEFDGAVYVQSDITDRKKQEHQLIATLKEKDYLMKELNHRVKNNLAMVSSLIKLKESEISVDLSDLEHRIQVIMLVHDKLHKQNDVQHIEVREYFQELLESVFSSTSMWSVDITNSIENICISTKTVIPLGLIVNEIATNSIKHGFTSDKEARFSIEMYLNSDDKHYVLKLSNNGIPFSEEINFDKPETTGLLLISSLVSQLNGTIELKKGPNPVFTIRFPMEDES